MGQDSSVGIATLYELDGPGIESRWGGRDFPQPSRLVLGSHNLLYNGYRGIPEGEAVALTTHPHEVQRLKKEDTQRKKRHKFAGYR